jgi:hypothetical protein
VLGTRGSLALSIHTQHAHINMAPCSTNNALTPTNKENTTTQDPTRYGAHMTPAVRTAFVFLHMRRLAFCESASPAGNRMCEPDEARSWGLRILLGNIVWQGAACWALR